MTSSAAVHQHFARQHLNATAEWIDECHLFCLSDRPSYTTAQLVDACHKQWLDSDIRIDGIQRRGGTPPAAADLSTAGVRAGSHLTVQVNSAHDVGQSAYSQVQKLNSVKDENSRVSAEDSTQQQFAAAWEPKPRRMLRFSLTTGGGGETSCLNAIEHQTLSQLKDPVPPGTKLTLIGPVVCRRGLLLLTPQNVKVLGGSVEEMQEEFSACRALSNQLHPGGNARVEENPTREYVPQGRPIKYRQGPPPPSTTASSKSKFAAHNQKSSYVRKQPPKVAAVTAADVFNDTDDELLASMDHPAVAAAGGGGGTGSWDGEDVFNDEEDELFSQIELEGPPLSATAKKRRQQ